MMQSLLALSFHPAFYPPKSGGEHRLYNIYNNLSFFYDVTLISFTQPNPQNEIEYVEHNKNFKEIRVPKTKISSTIHEIVRKFSKIKECSAIITSIESRFNNNFKLVINIELKKSENIVFVYPYLFTISKDLLKDKKIIYEAHNVEYEMMKQTLSNSIIGKILLRYVQNIEQSLSMRSNIIFAVSEENKKNLHNIYKLDDERIHVSPNGVNPHEYDELIKERNQEVKRNANICIFIGSYHPPNIDAIDCITKFAYKLPDTYFIIAGSASEYFIKNDNLIEPASKESFSILNNKNLAGLNGFYAVEYWNSIPTAWSKPEFKLFPPVGTDKIEVKLYSPYIQKIEAKFDDKSENFHLNIGWNLITISNIFENRSLLSFACEKILSDHDRELGIAVQEIECHIYSKILKLDLTRCSKLPFTFKKAKNVLLFGQISEGEKMELYSIADLALNPMMSGSGTNIKMLDYMAAGLPVITTPAGARGLQIENYNNAIICDAEIFPEKIKEVLGSKELSNKLSLNGRKLVEEKYDWRMIAGNMARILEENLK